MKRFILLGGLCATVPFVQAQDDPPAPSDPVPATAPAAPGPANGPGGGGRGGADQGPRPYDRVITKEAKTTEGVFKVHQIGTRYYYEIPAAELGKEFLWVSSIARTTIGAGNGGQQNAELVVRWERTGNRVLLREVNYDITADPAQPIAIAVEASKTPAIIMAFNVEAVGPSEASVIEVTRLFQSDVPEFSPRNRLRAV